MFTLLLFSESHTYFISFPICVFYFAIFTEESIQPTKVFPSISSDTSICSIHLLLHTWSQTVQSNIEETKNNQCTTFWVVHDDLKKDNRIFFLHPIHFSDLWHMRYFEKDCSLLVKRFLGLIHSIVCFFKGLGKISRSSENCLPQR